MILIERLNSFLISLFSLSLDIGSGYHRDQVTGPSSSSGHKAHTLVLTEEEKQLLSAEGVELPTDMPLTKVTFLPRVLLGYSC